MCAGLGGQRQLLAAQPEISFDETFARLRDELRRFEGIHAC